MGSWLKFHFHDFISTSPRQYKGVVGPCPSDKETFDSRAAAETLLLHEWIIWGSFDNTALLMHLLSADRPLLVPACPTSTWTHPQVKSLVAKEEAIMESRRNKFKENNVPWDTNFLADIKRGSLMLVCRPSISFASLASLPSSDSFCNAAFSARSEADSYVNRQTQVSHPSPLRFPYSSYASGRRTHEGLNC